MAHDEEGRAFERLGKRAGQNAQVQIWIPGQLSEFVVSGRGRECSAGISGARAPRACEGPAGAPGPTPRRPSSRVPFRVCGLCRVQRCAPRRRDTCTPGHLGTDDLKRNPEPHREPLQIVESRERLIHCRMQRALRSPLKGRNLLRMILYPRRKGAGKGFISGLCTPYPVTTLIPNRVMNDSV